ncbi:hypothetical protein RSal33209_1708 [Renibacterium salmoninarum ATCC 33209]|uniref:Uncharacterized protein n=1 Tax=Renibacterium salmoninarum (strain ATCC 33209 / DSM 20767 / JCM 11484 / NBRC 15589 / NCIMB 2235) TaxID=288705 RepID=A9WMU9_RENSM|nr:hypothetical protein [Renibacterium salmoninarum]ABY23444.1 hypothetical protein RSal33209_1708 [Renibacterium salmoninarum ATCC 33209]
MDSSRPVSRRLPPRTGNAHFFGEDRLNEHDVRTVNLRDITGAALYTKVFDPT